MKLGFTGTREGLSSAQWRELNNLSRRVEMTEAHHGCCIGADEEFHNIIGERAETHGHPPVNGRFAMRQRAKVMHPAKDYHERNREIVEATDQLLACPRGPEELRSGTWSTIRYAKRREKPVTIIWPDGTVSGPLA